MFSGDLTWRFAAQQVEVLSWSRLGCSLHHFGLGLCLTHSPSTSEAILQGNTLHKENSKREIQLQEYSQSSRSSHKRTQLLQHANLPSNTYWNQLASVFSADTNFLTRRLNAIGSSVATFVQSSKKTSPGMGAKTILIIWKGFLQNNHRIHQKSSKYRTSTSKVCLYAIWRPTTKIHFK